jgi:uncharacterized protein
MSGHTLQTREFAAALEIRAGGDGRTVQGLIAPYDVPTPIGGRFTETFTRGSFVTGRGVGLFAGHPRDDRDLPVAPAGSLTENGAGLLGEWRVSDTTAGRDLLTLIGDRAIGGLSVGFLADEAADEWSPDGRSVTRRRAVLDHVAAVERPAYAGAAILSVRAGRDYLAAADSAQRLALARARDASRLSREDVARLNAMRQQLLDARRDDPYVTGEDDPRICADILELAEDRRYRAERARAAASVAEMRAAGYAPDPGRLAAGLTHAYGRPGHRHAN